MNRLVIGNLLHRPLRSAISILAVTIEVAMILSIVGILFGQIEGSRRQSSGIGADLIVRPPNASFIAGVSGAPIRAKVADVIAQAPARGGRLAGHSAIIRESQCGDHLGH